MGAIRGEWLFPDSAAPSMEEVAQALQKRTGLEVLCCNDADGVLFELPLLRESLFDWEHHADRIVLHSFIPAHPYLWPQLDKVMRSFGARTTKDPIAWKPDQPNPNLDKAWSELSTRQRMVLRLRPIGAWRPLDWLAH